MRSSQVYRHERNLSLREGDQPSAFQYSRTRDLPRLVPLPQEELNDFTLRGRELLIALLFGQLRRERQRGIAGDWTYSLPRHRQLLIAYRAEKAAFVKARAGRGVR